MRQLSQLRQTISPHFLTTALPWQQRCGSAVRRLTTRSVRPSIERAALFRSPPWRLKSSSANANTEEESEEQTGSYSEADHEHAVISTFDLL